MFDTNDVATIEAVEEFIDTYRHSTRGAIRSYNNLIRNIREQQKEEWRAVVMRYPLHFIAYIGQTIDIDVADSINVNV